jgi:hypothetical protein
MRERDQQKWKPVLRSIALYEILLRFSHPQKLAIR